MTSGTNDAKFAVRRTSTRSSEDVLNSNRFHGLKYEDIRQTYIFLSQSIIFGVSVKMR